MGLSLGDGLGVGESVGVGEGLKLNVGVGVVLIDGVTVGVGDPIDAIVPNTAPCKKLPELLLVTLTFCPLERMLEFENVVFGKTK